jgi:hypothetical protein
MKKCSGARRAVILERIEGWPALGIERHNLAVNDRLIRHRGQSLHDSWVSDVEIVVVARTELNLSAGFDGESTVAIELQFNQPFRAFRQFLCTQ